MNPGQTTRLHRSAAPSMFALRARWYLGRRIRNTILATRCGSSARRTSRLPHSCGSLACENRCAVRRRAAGVGL